MKVKITCRPRYNPWLKKYLNTRTFSKMLALGVLINSVPINSFAGILSDDGRYETFEGSDITINDILEEDKVDVEIEGNTLVNKLGWVTSKNSNSVTIDNNNKTISFNKQVTGFNHSVTFGNATTEVNKTYTLVFNILKNTLVNTSDNNYSVAKFNIENYDIGNYHIYSGETSLVKVVLTQPSTSTNTNPYLEVYGVCEGELVIEKPYLLEGDWTNRELPEYFEGIKSVGEIEGSDSKLEIKSQNKNLIDNSKWEAGYYLDTDGKPTLLHCDADGKIEQDGVYRRRIDEFIKIKPNTRYTVTSKYNGRSFLYDKDFNYITNYVNSQSSFIAPPNAKYLRIHIDWIENSIPEGIQLEEGSTLSSYENNKTDKKELILKEPLRGLPNGTKDRIIKKNGQWIIERNCGEVVFDGSNDELWQINHIMNDCVAFYIDYNNVKKGILPVTDKLKQLNHFSIDEEGTFSSPSHENVLYITLNKDKLSTEDTDGLKKWLQLNPVRFVYPLKTPIYEPLSIESVVNLFKETTHISTNSIIPANLKVTIDRTLNRATEYTELAKTNPTIENLSKARYWNNLLKESIKKDQLQDEVNNIANINDLQLERKSATANMDVYVKSENMLSMSLDTNSVTFDNYSGVADMEILNAVNLTINSSLPYSLNAYMPSEISNADKSEIIPIDILNIRESNEGIYKTFTDTTDKIVLKDNCSNGNGLIHNVDLKLSTNLAHKADVYKTTIKFEAEQK